ncbi:MAG TPA: PadR family transcriptional regulator [Candidatus Thermoplasmatota archaeon]|nr:PadR family transcriptional regulator [Candidatus Thermoplasmatota archaeon]
MAIGAPDATVAEFLARLDRDLASGLQQLLVLGLVAKTGPLHGYGLIRALEQATGGRQVWKEGTIYPLLATLEREGLAKARWGTPTTGPRRKYYEATPAGRQVLRLAVGTWRELRAAVDQVVDA